VIMFSLAEAEEFDACYHEQANACVPKAGRSGRDNASCKAD
jgi:hypothetical protein